MDSIVELTAEECLSLLRTKVVGRIGLATDAGVRIFPVNYTVSEDRIVFRTLPYGAIATSAHGAHVAFEVDELDDELRIGWSVLAVGLCHRVDDPSAVGAIRSEGDVDAWAGGTRTLYFTVRWTELTGRQVGMQDRPR
jgi:nitroimidazol reductase NimA-like FMN-containing flavoprotein (pyridoxamine 5'-phosphate oxidase superfamily)